MTPVNKRTISAKKKKTVGTKRRAAKSYNDFSYMEKKTETATKKKVIKKEPVVKVKAVKKPQPKLVAKTTSAQKVEKKSVVKAKPKSVARNISTRTRKKIQAQISQKPEVSTTFVFEENLDLPENYHSTYVRLIAQNPHCLFAYWEIDGSAIEEMKSKTGNQFDDGIYTLRLYNVTCIDFNGVNANSWQDYDELFAKNRYLKDLSDNAVYCAEIGVRNHYGDFYSFYRSNFCATPRGDVSSRNDLIWREEHQDLDEKVFINVKLFDRKERSALSPRANWQFTETRIALSKDDLKKYYDNRQSLNKQLKSLAQLLGGQINDVSDVNGVGVIDGNLYIENSLIPGLMKQKSLKHQALGSSDSLGKPDMPFEIDMELTVKGKAEPGADVYLGGRPVVVNSDGSFILKYKLDDDFLPFNFVALSKEKALVKKIKTSVLRSKTEYEKSP